MGEANQEVDVGDELKKGVGWGRIVGKSREWKGLFVYGEHFGYLVSFGGVGERFELCCA
jgi:hypothetical protein